MFIVLCGSSLFNTKGFVNLKLEISASQVQDGKSTPRTDAYKGLNLANVCTLLLCCEPHCQNVWWFHRHSNHLRGCLWDTAWLSFWYMPVPSSGSVFIHMIIAQNYILDQNKSYWYKFTPVTVWEQDFHSGWKLIPMWCKCGVTVHSSMKSLSWGSGMGSPCVWLFIHMSAGMKWAFECSCISGCCFSPSEKSDSWKYVCIRRLAWSVPSCEQWMKSQCHIGVWLTPLWVFTCKHM